MKPMSQMNNLLSKALKENHLDCLHLVPALLHYLELLTTWNRVFNLTSLEQPHDLIYLHLIDSLIIAPYVRGQHCLDVGSGAGLPGIPLALFHPEQHWVLLDKNSKKTRFLTQVAAELKLSNVEIVHSRSEDFHPGPSFDNILCRALGSLSLFVETTEHMLKNTGQWIAMKAKYPKEELQALPHRFRLQEAIPIKINGLHLERHLIMLAFNIQHIH
jgi:16S rRNA (guanine527-N7)-methyltransferase